MEMVLEITDDISKIQGYLRVEIRVWKGHTLFGELVGARVHVFRGTNQLRKFELNWNVNPKNADNE